jgi:superfamily I DNA/RNA helicase
VVWHLNLLSFVEWHARHARARDVAATRAKDRLVITHAAERGRRPTGGPSPGTTAFSRWITDCAPM